MSAVVARPSRSATHGPVHGPDRHVRAIPHCCSAPSERPDILRGRRTPRGSSPSPAALPRTSRVKLTGERPMEGHTPDSLLALHDAGYREVIARLGKGRILDVGCGVGME